MDSVLFEFENMGTSKCGGYILQWVKNRRLTDVYHAHDFYELIWFIRGRAEQRINEKIYPCIENSVVLLRPFDRHCFVGQTDDVQVISLSVEKEEFMLLSGAYSSLPASLLSREHGHSEFICKTNFWENPFFAALIERKTVHDCKSLLSFFLGELIASADCKGDAASMPYCFEQAVKNMSSEENLRRGIPAFAELAGYSHSHLARLVRKYFGMGLKQYINELRLQKACQQLMLTPMAVWELSESLGFLSYSHFNKIFKARFGMTPSAFRKKNGSWTA